MGWYTILPQLFSDSMCGISDLILHTCGSIPSVYLKEKSNFRILLLDNTNGGTTCIGGF